MTGKFIQTVLKTGDILGHIKFLILKKQQFSLHQFGVLVFLFRTKMFQVLRSRIRSFSTYGISPYNHNIHKLFYLQLW